MPWEPGLALVKGGQKQHRLPRLLSETGPWKGQPSPVSVACLCSLRPLQALPGPRIASRCPDLCRGLWEPQPSVPHSVPCWLTVEPWAAQLCLLPPRSINGATLELLASFCTPCLPVTTTLPQVDPDWTSVVSSHSSANSAGNTSESPWTPV